MLLRIPAFAWLLFALYPTIAAAGEGRVTIDLPAAEDPALWRAPLDLAGLTLAAEPRRATVQIRAVGRLWRVHTVVDGVITRTIDVPEPTTEQEREELAFLTRALARTMKPPSRPAGGLTQAPPPPSPLVAPSPERPPLPPRASQPTPPPPPVPTTPDPPVDAPPTPTPEAPEAPEKEVPLPADPAAPSTPETPAPAAEPGPPEPAAPSMSPPAAPDVERPAGELGATPRKSRTSSLSTPSMALSLGVATRATTRPGARFGLQTDLIREERLGLGVEVGASPSRGLEMNLDRTVWDVNMALVGSMNFDPHLRFEALAGVGYLAFRQQFVPIDEALVPQVGLSAEAYTGGSKLRVGIRGRARADFGSITLVDERGNFEKLSPVEVGLDFVVRLSALGDPDRSLPTLPGQ